MPRDLPEKAKILQKAELIYNSSLLKSLYMPQRLLQFHLGQRAYVVRLRAGFFILCLFLFVIFCALGVWQLHRYHYKAQLLMTFQNRLNTAPYPLRQLVDQTQDLQFRVVVVEGNYLNEVTFLVQNKFYQGQLGFEVLTPVRIPGEKRLLLVDRGWIAKPQNQALPSIAFVHGSQRMTGYIQLQNEYSFTLGKNILTPSIFPVVMQKINMDEISQLTQQSFFPFIVRLNASNPHGYVRDWVISTAPPERHFAYAVQWFALSIVLLIGYICFCCERIQS